MKINRGFILRNVADTHIVVPVGANALEHQGMIYLNESGVFLWEKLMEGAEEAELLSAMLQEYEVNEQQALNDIGEFLSKVRALGALDES